METMLSKIRRTLFLSALATLLITFIPAQAQQATEKEPNNEAAQANPIELNQEVTGFFGEEDDEDWFVLTIPAPGVENLVVEVTGVPDVDVCLDLLAPGEEEIERDQPGRRGWRGSHRPLEAEGGQVPR